jgi:hypothetical protein
MIFKKHISLLIAMLVLVSNSGLAFNVHYCEGEIASISSVFTEDEVCEMPVVVEKICCAKPESTHKECCSDKKVDLKNKTEKIIIKSISLDFEPAYFAQYKASESSVVTVENHTDKSIAHYCETNAPPLYKLYCQLTFYA